MPLIDDPIDAPAPPPPPGQINATLSGPEYRHSLVDLKEQPPTALLTHIEGSSWTVDYYSQVVGSDEELSTYQPGQVTPYQQYLLIKGYELKLQGSLSYNQDEETGSFTVTGSALLYPYLIPNVGDVIIGDIGDGKAGQFNVTTVVRKTILKEACFEIGLQLARDATEQLISDIGQKVVKTAYFQRDFMTFGQNPILVESEVNARKRIEGFLSALFNKWMMESFSREYKTFLVPGQVIPTYDPFLTKTILRMYDRNAHPMLRMVKEINCDGERIMEEFNLWSALLGKDESLRQVMAQKMWLVNAKEFNASPYYEGVYFSGIGYVVYPNLVEKSVDADYNGSTSLTGVQYRAINDADWHLASVFLNNVAGGFVSPDDDPLAPSYGAGEVPYIHPVTLDDFYVFSEFFYTRSTVNQSKLEILTNNMLAGDAIDHDALFALCEDAPKWGRLERFYYVPVLLILLKVALRNL